MIHIWPKSRLKGANFFGGRIFFHFLKSKKHCLRFIFNWLLGAQVSQVSPNRTVKIDGQDVEVYERDSKYHGKFVLFYDEPPAGGFDIKNPDPALRDRSLIGADFILNFEFVDQKWKNGRIYNPENGKQYRADLELKDGVLKVRGWIWIRLLGRTVEWKRIS